MNKKKNKSSEITNKKQGTLVVPRLTPEIESSFDTDPDFWSKEIEAVKSERYDSVESAIEAIAERVVKRISSPTIDDAETKRFVSELLASNDEVVETLKSVLDIA